MGSIIDKNFFSLDPRTGPWQISVDSQLISYYITELLPQAA